MHNNWSVYEVYNNHAPAGLNRSELYYEKNKGWGFLLRGGNWSQSMLIEHRRWSTTEKLVQYLQDELGISDTYQEQLNQGLLEPSTKLIIWYDLH